MSLLMDQMIYENDEIVYSFDCHYFDLHRELFQASFSPMKHINAFIYFFKWSIRHDLGIICQANHVNLGFRPQSIYLSRAI